MFQKLLTSLSASTRPVRTFTLKTPTMRFLMLMASFTLASCSGNNPAKEITSNESVPGKKPAVSQPADKEKRSGDEAYINTLLEKKQKEGWHVLNDKEAGWMKGVFDYFIVPKRKELPDYPYITKGDFNADGRSDLAAVVTNAKKNAYQVAIITDTSAIDFWTEDILEDAALSMTPRSTIEGAEGERAKKIKLKGDGINVEYFEKASFVIYWTGSGYKKIQTGD
jgi:hypothetical protein